MQTHSFSSFILLCVLCVLCGEVSFHPALSRPVCGVDNCVPLLPAVVDRIADGGIPPKGTALSRVCFR
jgi:hypothetical protein